MRRCMRLGGRATDKRLGPPTHQHLHIKYEGPTHDTPHQTRRLVEHTNVERGGMYDSWGCPF